MGGGSWEVAGRRFTVVGAGRSGVAAANALSRRGGDVRLVEAKAAGVRPAELDVGVTFIAGSQEVRSGDVAVLSPGIAEVSPVRHEVARQAIEVIGEVEVFARLCALPVLAVTGTDGKSTVTTMLGAIMEEAGWPAVVGGNLGNPLTGELEAAEQARVVVAEVSCFQLTTCTTFAPRVACVTNIAEDHTDYHGSFERYQAAKQLIWQAMTSESELVLNRDDPFIRAWQLPKEPKISWVSLSDERADAFWGGPGCALEIRRGRGAREALMTRDELGLLGVHNVYNALMAAQVAVAFGVEPSHVRAALMRYRPLPHRLARVGVFGGVAWVDDSKATSPNAAMAAMRAVERPMVLIAGGSSKGVDFGAWGTVARERANFVICQGETRHELAAVLGEHPHRVVATLHEAIEVARAVAKPGETVLFSPACASFDQFGSYAERGEAFAAEVRAQGGSC